MNISEINQQVTDLHYSHYVNNPDGLVIKDAQPGDNTIYHLYNDGEITMQKGGWAYGNRGEFTLHFSVIYGSSPFTFPKKSGEHTYAILTEDECLTMREKMKKK